MILNLTGDQNQQIKASNPVPARYQGFSLRELTGVSPALVQIFDGMNASGLVLEEIALGPGESARELYREGISAARGIFVQVTTGQVTGSIRYAQ